MMMITTRGSLSSEPKPEKAQFHLGDAAACAPSVRVLLAEDFEPFRRFISSTLSKGRATQIICEVSDGLVAVEKAEELKPDLILLDIGLPTLNGIEVARRIRTSVPQSKIVFVSQESSADVAQEAFSLGALGYVVKTRAGSELLAAVEAVRQGRKFISGGLSGRHFTESIDAQIPDPLCHKGTLSSLATKKGTAHRHEVTFYSDDASFLVGFARFIEGAMEAGNPVIVVTTESHRGGLFQKLQAHGVDRAAAIEQGRYIPLDVAETLSTFMVNNLPDQGRFLKVARDLLAAAAKGAKGEHSRVAACGECAPSLWAQGKADAAIELEHLWDEIAKTCDVDILCGYVLNDFQREREGHVYKRICAEHSAVCSQ
jgi:DNA-binding NarL/FixJ family response regulator